MNAARRPFADPPAVRHAASHRVGGAGPHPALPALLEGAQGLLADLGAEYRPDRERLEALAARLASGRFHLAVLGQFKRGKSTLLNALLGEGVLPTAVVPLTAIPTFIRSGEARAVEVVPLDDRPRETHPAEDAEALRALLAAYVTETHNPANERNVSYVEITHPSPLLRQGVVLVDTPGIGSTFRHNTEATLNFLPQCDAALFLVSADPPITEVEVAFLREVRRRVPRLFFILNKVDYLSTDERDEAIGFLRQVLTEHVGADPETPLFCVSARRGLEARRAGDPRLWEASGLAAVERGVVAFLTREKSQALNAAVAREAADALGDSLMRLRLNVRSLQMPLEDLEKRLAAFDRAIEEIERQRIVVKDLLAGDRKRLHASLEEYAGDLRRTARSYLDGVVREALARSPSKAVDEEALRDALAAAVPGFFEHAMGTATETFEAHIRDALSPHRRRADALAASVRRTAAELFEVPYRASGESEAFEMVRRPYWVTHQWSAVLRPLSEGLVERLMPAGARRARILRRLAEQVDGLAVRNVENLRWALYQSLDHAFLRFGKALDERFAGTLAATRGAVRSAADRRAQRRRSVSEEAKRLEGACARLEEALAALQSAVAPSPEGET